MKNVMRAPALCLLLVLVAVYSVLALMALCGMVADGWLTWVEKRIDGISQWGIRGHG